MSRTELIIQLLKVALGLAIGAYFVWWTTASGNTVRWDACYKALPHYKRVLAIAMLALALTLSAVTGADACGSYFGAPPVVVLGCCSVCCFGPL